MVFVSPPHLASDRSQRLAATIPHGPASFSCNARREGELCVGAVCAHHRVDPPVERLLLLRHSLASNAAPPWQREALTGAQPTANLLQRP